MNTKSNKEIVTHIFTELSQGNDKPLLESMSDDMQWNWMGSGQLSKSFVGKSEVVNELWHSVRTTIKQPYMVEVHRITGDNDYFAIEMTGRNTTYTGKVYENKYCWICHIKNGKLSEINEYMDTELVTNVFGKK